MFYHNPSGTLYKMTTFNNNYYNAHCFRPSFINCPLESNELALRTPLEILLKCILSFNILEMILGIFIFILLFNRFIYNNNVRIISKYLNKYNNNKFVNWRLRTKFLNKSLNYNNNFITILFIIIVILFIIFKLINIYFSAELYLNTKDYVNVYNHLRGIDKNSIFIFLSLNNKIFKDK
uniref:hypothetical protein n=1 Tax=Pallidohirschioporus biformis TaxID=50381 RepID=UPI002E761522|nr:hypothetical protein V2724_mgp28 [Pallidohirschioporus biformis]WQA11104.1 hypothetical protein [Pallidohirschioporus biformis]